MTSPRGLRLIGDYQVLRAIDPAGGLGRRAFVAIKQKGVDRGRLFVLKALGAKGPLWALR